MIGREWVVLGLAAMLVSGLGAGVVFAQCEGDFNGDNMVTIDELVVAVDNMLDDCAIDGARFVDNGDGTVTDVQTGLMWEQKESLDNVADLGNPRDADNTYTWGDAMSEFVSLLNGYSADGTAQTPGLGGHSDWRMPTSAELQSILLRPYPCGIFPCIDAAFGPTAESDYWSSTSFFGAPSAWSVSFSGAWPLANGGKITTRCARAVRGGL